MLHEFECILSSVYLSDRIWTTKTHAFARARCCNPQYNRLYENWEILSEVSRESEAVTVCIQHECLSCSRRAGSLEKLAIARQARITPISPIHFRNAHTYAWQTSIYFFLGTKWLSGIGTCMEGYPLANLRELTREACCQVAVPVATAWALLAKSQTRKDYQVQVQLSQVSGAS